AEKGIPNESVRVETALIIAFLAFSMLSASATAGYFQDGNKLYRVCTAEKGEASYFQDIAFCTGYIAGVIDQIELSSEYTKNSSQACTPENATQGQLRDILIKYLRNNPEKRNLAGSTLVVLSMLEAFPNCSK
ncbi:MAG: Rap1a/Tai family immunity protein, partial [Sandarakinorhabdus sp.]